MKKLKYFAMLFAMGIASAFNLFSIEPSVKWWVEENMLGSWLIMSVVTDTNNDGCYDHVVIFVDGVKKKEWDLLKIGGGSLPSMEQAHLFTPAHVWTVDTIGACGDPTGVSTLVVRDTNNNLVGTLIAACPDSIMYATVILPPPLPVISDVVQETIEGHHKKLYNKAAEISLGQLGMRSSVRLTIASLTGVEVKKYINLTEESVINVGTLGNGVFVIFDENHNSVLLINDVS